MPEAVVEQVQVPNPAPIAASDQPAQTPSAPQADAIQEGEKPQSQTTEEQPAKQGKNRFERRLDRAYRREAEAKARADLLEKRLAELEAKANPQSQAIEGEPKLSDFDDIEKYAQAKAEFREKKAIEKYEAQQRQRTQQQTQTQLKTSWEERAEKASSKYDDWDDVVGEIEPNNPLTVAIMRASNGDDVAYHLGKNLKEAQRIAGLDPVSQVLAIGELSARLSAEPPKAKTPSKAPPPISPVSGTSAPSPEDDLSEADMKKFIKIRAKQLGRAK